MNGKFYSDGSTVDYTAGSDIAAGTVTSLSSKLLGIATTPIANGAKGALAVRGCFILPKATGFAPAQGSEVFWDAADGNCNTDATNPLAGIVAEAAGSSDTTVKVLINQHAWVASS